MKNTIIKNLFLCLLVAAAVFGLSCVTPPEPEPVPPPPPPPPPPLVEQVYEEVVEEYESMLILDGAQRYTVVYENTLSEITRRFYGNLTDVYDAGIGNGFYFPIIILASPHHDIADPDLIHPGMELIIPDLKRNLADRGARDAIKAFLHDVALIYSIRGDTPTSQGLRTLSDSIPQ